MLHDIQELHGHQLTATDGGIGQVKDFYFDDRLWVIRYLVADTGSWLRGRLVLLTPHAFGRWDHEGKNLAVNLTRQQVEDCPAISEHEPVSRQYEIDYYGYYGWPTYWTGRASWGLGGFPAATPPALLPPLSDRPSDDAVDGHLQSIKAVHGYQIHAIDGPIGTVSGFRVDDESWQIGEIAVATGHWYAGKVILIATKHVERISYEESSVYVRLTKAELQAAGDNEVAEAGSEQLRD